MRKSNNMRTEQTCVISGRCIKNEDEVSCEQNLFLKPSVICSACRSNVGFLLQLCCVRASVLSHPFDGVAYLCVNAVQYFLKGPHSEIITTYFPVPVLFNTVLCGVIIIRTRDLWHLNDERERLPK